MTEGTCNLEELITCISLIARKRQIATLLKYVPQNASEQRKSFFQDAVNTSLYARVRHPWLTRLKKTLSLLGCLDLCEICVSFFNEVVRVVEKVRIWCFIYFPDSCFCENEDKNGNNGLMD